MTVQFDIAQLESHATDLATLSSNIGEIGMGIDYSNNNLANELQNRFPLVDWLLRTSATRRAMAERNNGSMNIHRANGELNYVAPWTVGTLPPEDTTGECCWIPFDLTKCGSEVPLKLLCLKDCDKILDNLVFGQKRFGSNDLVGEFARVGQTVKEARTEMARLSMAWFTARNIILGTTTTATATLKPFHGLLEVVEDASVVKVLGSNILAAFDMLGCRISQLGDGEYVFAVHPLVYESIKREVVVDRFGRYPEGWSRDGDEVRFSGIGFIRDKLVPIDMSAGTGDVWMLDGMHVGALMGTSLRPGADFIREDFNTDTVANGCAQECTYYYNYGTVFGSDSNHLAVITNVPVSANCLGEAMTGLDLIIQPNTLVPIQQ